MSRLRRFFSSSYARKGAFFLVVGAWSFTQAIIHDGAMERIVFALCAGGLFAIGLTLIITRLEVS